MVLSQTRCLAASATISSLLHCTLCISVIYHPQLALASLPKDVIQQTDGRHTDKQQRCIAMQHRERGVPVDILPRSSSPSKAALLGCSDEAA